MTFYGIVTAPTAPMHKTFDLNSERLCEAPQGERLALHAKVDRMRLVVKLSDHSMGWMRESDFKITKTYQGNQGAAPNIL